MVKKYNNVRRETMEEPETFEFIPPKPERIYKRKPSNIKRSNNDMSMSILDRRQEHFNEFGFIELPKHRDLDTFIEGFGNRPGVTKQMIRKHAKK